MTKTKHKSWNLKKLANLITLRLTTFVHVKTYKEDKIASCHLRETFGTHITKIITQKNISPTGESHPLPTKNKQTKNLEKWAKPMDKYFVEEERQGIHKLNENMFNLNLISK